MKSSIELMYNRLAEFLLSDIDLHEKMTILEGGCGRGQLTLPIINILEKELHNYNYVALDLSSGSYEGALSALKEKILGTKFYKKVELIEGDVTSIPSLKDESFSLIISNELFCDLDRKGLEKALKEFYRILQPNGQMCHSELIPFPSNYPQELFIKADSYTIEPLTAVYEWFSPCVDEVVALMHKTGFRDFKVKYFETNVQLSYNEAIEELKGWDIDESFTDNYENDLKKYGIEYPLEHVIYCRK